MQRRNESTPLLVSGSCSSSPLRGAGRHKRQESGEEEDEANFLDVPASPEYIPNTRLVEEAFGHINQHPAELPSTSAAQPRSAAPSGLSPENSITEGSNKRNSLEQPRHHAMAMFRLMVRSWQEKYQNTSRKDKLFYLALVVVVLGSWVTQFFGMNWWLASFRQGCSNYAGLILPALFWGLCFLVVGIVYNIWLMTQSRKRKGRRLAKGEENGRGAGGANNENEEGGRGAEEEGAEAQDMFFWMPSRHSVHSLVVSDRRQRSKHHMALLHQQQERQHRSHPHRHLGEASGQQPTGIESRRSVGVGSSGRGDFLGVKLLVAIATIDALGGLTSMYSVPHVPQFTQSMIYSTGPFMTWLLSKIFTPAKAPPLNLFLGVSFLFSIAGVVVASVESLKKSGGGTAAEQQSEGGKVGWLLIFFLGSTFPCLYNVLQGWFLTHYQHAPNVSKTTAKITVLMGDTLLQIVVTMALFPMDIVPWFGTSKSLPGTWSGTINSAKCLWECPNNMLYFFLFSAGLIVGRISCAFLNHYSPTLGSFILLFGGPINALLLIAIPSWNAFPSPGGAEERREHWYLQVICIVCLLVSIALYSMYEEACRAHEALERKVLRGELLGDDDEEGVENEQERGRGGE